MFPSSIHVSPSLAVQGLLGGILLIVGGGSVEAQNTVRPMTRPIAPQVLFDLRYGAIQNEQFSPGDVEETRAFRSEKPTIGRDKVLHFTISAAWTGLTYYGLDRSTEWPSGRSLGVAAGSAVGLGVGKELHDATTPKGDASGKDLLADALGIGAAVGIIIGSW